MMPQEQEISLVMQRDHLLTSELEHGGGGDYLEHPPGGVPQFCYEVLQNKCAINRARPYNLVMSVITFDGRRFERTHQDAS